MSQVDPFQMPVARAKELERTGHSEQQATYIALAEHYERQGNVKMAKHYRHLAGISRATKS